MRFGCSRSAVAASTAILVATGCSPHKVTTDPAPPLEMPASYAAGAEGAAPEEWWTTFSDPELDRLVAAALAGNLELDAAWARLQQADAIARQAGAPRWPQLDASFGASRRESRSPFAGVEDAPPGLPETFRIDNFALSAAASYEVDLFRRIGSTASAAALDARAAREEVEAAAITLSAQVAETWFDLVFQRARRQLLERQIEVSETFLELARLRFEQGLGSSLDVFQQQQQLVAVRAQLPLADAADAVLQHQLAALLGEAPQGFAVGARAELPAPPPLPGTGLPGDLLERRPDVRAARLRVVSADHRVAAAVADRLPSLRLSGEYGFQSNDIGELLKSPVWAIAGSIVGPLLDGGRRAAEVDRNEAVVQELRYRYGQILLTAIVEVENALVQERQQRAHIEALEEQLRLADETLEQARARYREGIGEQGFLQVLTALQSQQQAELTLLQARRQLLSFRIQLCRALGGTWTRGLEPDRAEEG